MGRPAKRNGRREKRSALDVYALSDTEDAQKTSDRYDRASTVTGMTSLENYEPNIASDDDEEIEEDEAFGEEDQLKMTKNREINMNEFSEEEDDPEEEEPSDFEADDGAIDLSKMLGDMNDDSDESDENQEEFSQEEEDPVDLSAIAHSLGKSKKRSHTEEEITEAYPESEFHTAAKRKVKIADLMATLEDVAGFGRLKKNLEALEKPKSTGVVAAPLPKRQQDRLNRIAAYTETKADITKWQPIVKKQREAEHLTFPLNAPGKHNVTSASMAAKFEASNDLERNVQQLLESSGMLESQIKKSEELELNKLSAEQVRERQAELQKMRSLLFHAEQKMKRIAKIKSKTYHRIKKREKLRKAQKEFDETEEQEGVLDEAALLELESNRALERMTLKHSNTGKWAHALLRRGEVESGTRQAVNDQLEYAKLLRKRMQGHESDDSSNDEDQHHTDDDNVDEEQRDQDNLWRIEQSLDEPTLPSDETKSGLFAMGFMQKAQQRKRAEAKAMLDELKQEMLSGEVSAPLSLRRQNDDEDQDVDSEEEERNEAKATLMALRENKNEKVQRIVKSHQAARVSFERNDNAPVFSGSHEVSTVSMTSGFQVAQVASGAASGAIAVPLFEVEEFPAVEIVKPVKSIATLPEQAKPVLNPKRPMDELKFDSDNEGESENDSKSSNPAVNPWLSEKCVAPRKSKVPQRGTAEEKLLKRVKRLRQSDDEPEQALQEEAPVMDLTEKGNEDESELDERDISENSKSKHTSLATQRELIARAFAHDDVVAQFEAEKEAQIKADAPQIQDLTLPGWGSWGGVGACAPPAPKRRVLKLPKKGDGVEREQRQDRHLKHVIISERQPKQTALYQTKTVPFPFKTREQYERHLATPLGAEWQTQSTHQELTKPKVLVQQGVAIAPPRLSKKLVKQAAHAATIRAKEAQRAAAATKKSLASA